jgi:hypothetical protein
VGVGQSVTGTQQGREHEGRERKMLLKVG